jgi:DNA end-binding protein Ku
MPRAIWKGAVSLGLVTVPVKLYSATASKRIAFHQIDRRSGARVRNKRVSEKTGREVPYDEIVKGYEVGDDTYVVLEPEELEALESEATHTIEITDFVELAEVDPMYFESTYYLAPESVGKKAYALLLKAMKKSGLAAIGRVVIRTKEHLCAIRPTGDGVLALHTMLFHDEIVNPRAINELRAEAAVVGQKEMKMAEQLIESLTVAFDAEAYRDTYREQLEKLLAKKAEGKTITIEAPEEKPKVVDLIEALKASVEQTEKPKRKRKTVHRKSA